MDLTLEMISVVQQMLVYGRWPRDFRERLERIERYLCDRYVRD